MDYPKKSKQFFNYRGESLFFIGFILCISEKRFHARSVIEFVAFLFFYRYNDDAT